MKLVKFANELGNPITIKIKNKNESGKNYKTDKKIKFKGVSVMIEGPTSTAEWVITKMEAIKLYETLGEFLGN